MECRGNRNPFPSCALPVSPTETSLLNATVCHVQLPPIPVPASCRQSQFLYKPKCLRFRCWSKTWTTYTYPHFNQNLSHILCLIFLSGNVLFHTLQGFTSPHIRSRSLLSSYWVPCLGCMPLATVSVTKTRYAATESSNWAMTVTQTINRMVLYIFLVHYNTKSVHLNHRVPLSGKRCCSHVAIEKIWEQQAKSCHYTRHAIYQSVNPPTMNPRRQAQLTPAHEAARWTVFCHVQ